LQFLILDKITEDEDGIENKMNIDVGVSETWKFMRDHWNLHVPKMIISVIDDTESINMNRQLMKSIMFNLVKTAAAEGTPTSQVYIRKIPLCAQKLLEKPENVFQLFPVLFEVENNILKIYRNQSTGKLSNPIPKTASEMAAIIKMVSCHLS